MTAPDATGTTRTVTGRCACGAVGLRITGPLRPVIACHCDSCRRQSGHIVAATAALRDDIEIEGAENLNWWRATPDAQRGFCRTCGSLMLWQRDGSEAISIMAGCLDAPTGLNIQAHIFAAEAGDYYVPGHDTAAVYPGHERSVEEGIPKRMG
ncbi:MAG: GFA family protein [Pseudomonadota bacterium]